MEFVQIYLTWYFSCSFKVYFCHSLKTVFVWLGSHLSVKRGKEENEWMSQWMKKLINKKADEWIVVYTNKIMHSWWKAWCNECRYECTCLARSRWTSSKFRSGWASAELSGSSGPVRWNETINLGSSTCNGFLINLGYSTWNMIKSTWDPQPVIWLYQLRPSTWNINF